MNDPWEGIRHTLSVMPAQWLIPDPIMRFLMADGKKLLADADALLRYYRAAEAYIPLAEYGGGVSRDVGADVVQTIMDEYAAACDALTEHLKGE